MKLSITDTSSTSYGIKWADNPSTPVDYVFYPHNSIKVSSPNNDIFSIDSISWDWSDFDTSGYSEDRFALMKYENSWKSAGGSLSTSSHKITLSALSVAATYTIFQQNPPKKSLQLSYLLGCDKTTITVKDDKGNPVSGASVNFDTLDKLSTFSSDNSGQVVVPSCGKAFTVSATKTDYNYVSLHPDQYQCTCMKCTQNFDCSLYQKCEGL